MNSNIKVLFLDIGGVLGTNGWDGGLRKKAAQHFALDFEEMNERHHLTFDTYEVGKLSLDEYLKRVVFYEKRAFSRDEFIHFMYAGSEVNAAMMDFFISVKKNHQLKVIAVNNEGKELNEHRIKKFELHRLIDFFISSASVHFRKPDTDIYRVAIDTAQVLPNEIAYVDDRAMFVEVAMTLGVNGVHHKDLNSTKIKFSELGLSPKTS